MPKTISISYQFKFKDNHAKTFVAELDFDTLALVNQPTEPLPEWTLLKFHKCSNCPLAEATSPRCPAAVGMADLVEFCKDIVSYEEVDVTVTTEARTYFKQTTMEEGAGSLIGILMAASGCPKMARMRPLIDSHLPFASPSEATYRMLSMFLVAKCFQSKAGKHSEWDLNELVGILKDVQEVNTDFFKRLNAISTKDAARNAMVVLNNLAFIAGRSVEMNRLQRLEQLFTTALP
jgi:hypothetical protein